MKKTYQNPQTDILTMAADLMAAVSNCILGDDPTTETIDLGAAVNTTDATSGNLSRRSLWDDTDDGDEY